MRRVSFNREQTLRLLAQLEEAVSELRRRAAIGRQKGIPAWLTIVGGELADSYGSTSQR